MVYRLQYIFLICFAFSCFHVEAGDQIKLDKDTFSLGLHTGVLSIQDFNSEFYTGLQGSFKASEDFFLQVNYFQAEASAGSFELAQGFPVASGDDRNFTHYGFTLGYNLFQAEFYGSGPESAISAFYLVAGAGETQFLGEANFTVTLGAGYQFALNRHYVLSLDYRSYNFKTRLLGEDSYTLNTQFGVGFSYLF